MSKMNTLYLFVNDGKWNYESALYGVERGNDDNHVGGGGFEDMNAAMLAASRDEKVLKPFVGAVADDDFAAVRTGNGTAPNPNLPTGSTAGSVVVADEATPDPDSNDN